jgi:hypothetical protein
MPTLSKPQLKETPSVWRKPSAEIKRELAANKEVILGKLGFYREHGRPEDFDGKFAKQVLAQEKEVIAEIAGILTLAASIAAQVIFEGLQRVRVERARLVSKLNDILDASTADETRLVIKRIGAISRYEGRFYSARKGAQRRRQES